MEVTGAPVNQTVDGQADLPLHPSSPQRLQSGDYQFRGNPGVPGEPSTAKAISRTSSLATPLDQLIEENDSFFGCVVGRYSNRIAKGKFSLDGREYTLATNDKENHLHGGLKGFDKVVWDSESFEDQEGVGVKLEYLSPDGEEGYPGNLSVTVTYTFTKAGDLKIHYHATTDQKTRPQPDQSQLRQCRRTRGTQHPGSGNHDQR